MKAKSILLALAGFATSLQSAHALVLDFYDNVEAPPGAYGLVYLNYYDAPRLNDTKGDEILASNDGSMDMTVTAVAVRPVWYFEGADRLWAFNFIASAGELRARNFTTGSMQTSSGAGDFLIGPALFLVRSPKTGTFLSFWEFASCPTGDFDKQRSREGGPNFGLGYWYLQHQLAFATSFVEGGSFSLDANVNYYQRLSTGDLAPADTVECEGIVGYGITATTRVGAYASYLQDVGSSRYFGGTVERRRGVVVGTSVAYSTPKWGANLRVVWDQLAENGPEGWQVFGRVNWSF